MRHQRHSRRSHSSIRRKGLFLLLAAVLAVCLLYSCAGEPAYSPRGRLVFVPLAQIWPAP